MNKNMGLVLHPQKRKKLNFKEFRKIYELKITELKV